MMNRIPPVVRNLLIINVLFFVATYIMSMKSGDDWMTRHLALYYPGSSDFRPYQFVTHMFMHGGWAHIFFNMYALWMFGSPIENIWGAKRFTIYYFFTGLGAAALHTFVNYLVFRGIQADIIAFGNTPSPEVFKSFIDNHAEGFSANFIAACNSLYEAWMNVANVANSDAAHQYAGEALYAMERVRDALMDVPTVGASGAIFGLLLAFGMMYPDARLMIIFLPIAIKAKWFVLIYGGIELALGLTQPGSSIAHFAHVGGMLFGYILIRFWIAKARRRH